MAGGRLGFWFKGLQAVFLAVAICLSLGVTDAASRFNNLGHRMMCTCGCAQLLGECNHVGCPSSTAMRKELSNAIANGASDKEILAAFSSKYGATVLAAPSTHGFDLVAWITPFALFAVALLGTILLVRRWSFGKAPVPAGGNAATDVLREQIRRETGMDGGA